MTLVPTHHGTAVLASIGPQAVPGTTLSTIGLDPGTAAAVDESLRAGRLVIVGTPDPAFRRLLLSTLVSTLAAAPRTRRVICLDHPTLLRVSSHVWWPDRITKRGVSLQMSGVPRGVLHGYCEIQRLADAREQHAD